MDDLLGGELIMLAYEFDEMSIVALPLGRPEVLVIIPARGGSKGIRMKNVALCDGVPLVVRTVDTALQSAKVGRVVVSTENETIKTAVLYGDYWGNIERLWVHQRPDFLATDTSGSELTMKDVILWLAMDFDYHPDVVVLMQCTNQATEPKDLDEAIAMLATLNYDSILSVVPAHKFLWRNGVGSAWPMNYEPEKRKMRQLALPEYIENGALYVSTIEAFTKSECRVSGRIGLHVMDPEDGIEIDTPLDLALAERALQYKRGI
jgi:CMP-N-acetylneuraminic acid synthetase